MQTSNSFASKGQSFLKVFLLWVHNTGVPNPLPNSPRLVYSSTGNKLSLKVPDGHRLQLHWHTRQTTWRIRWPASSRRWRRRSRKRRRSKCELKKIKILIGHLMTQQINWTLTNFVLILRQLNKYSEDLNNKYLNKGNIWRTTFHLFAIQMPGNISLFKPWPE